MVGAAAVGLALWMGIWPGASGRRFAAANRIRPMTTASRVDKGGLSSETPGSGSSRTRSPRSLPAPVPAYARPARKRFSASCASPSNDRNEEEALMQLIHSRRTVLRAALPLALAALALALPTSGAGFVDLDDNSPAQLPDIDVRESVAPTADQLAAASALGARVEWNSLGAPLVRISARRPSRDGRKRNGRGVRGEKLAVREREAVRARRPRPRSHSGARHRSPARTTPMRSPSASVRAALNRPTGS